MWKLPFKDQSNYTSLRIKRIIIIHDKKLIITHDIKIIKFIFTSRRNLHKLQRKEARFLILHSTICYSYVTLETLAMRTSYNNFLEHF